MPRTKSGKSGIPFKMRSLKRLLGVQYIICICLLVILYLTNVKYVAANMPMVAEVNEDASAINYDNEFLSKAQKCRLEKSPLDRLDCYDNAWQDGNELPLNTAIPTGEIWQRANDNEVDRAQNSLAFKVSDSGIDIDRQVIITTPALGSQPPRPIFMVSCKDNITRMQIVLMKPIKGSDINVNVMADNRENTFKWFIRENGYVIESSRGLDGIAEINALFDVNKLQISTENNSFSTLTFLIDDLKQTIKPLREACHW